MPFSEQDLYGHPEPTKYKRVNIDRLEALEGFANVMRDVYVAARDVGLINANDGAEKLIAAIRALPR